MPQLIRVGNFHWLSVRNIDAFQEFNNDLIVWIASNFGGIRIPGLSGEEFRAQFPPADAARLFQINRGYFVSLDGITAVEHDGRNLRLRLRGNALVPLHPATAETLEAALEKAGRL